jgi:protease-4
MKNFLSSMLGALAALMIFTGAAAAFFLVLIVAISALGEKPVLVEDGSYLVVDLSTNITDAPPLVDFGALMGRKMETLQLRAATNALKAAAGDDRIQGVLIVGSLQPAGYGSGFAALQELRTALNDFKAANKPVKAYLTYAMTRDFYLAAAADEVVLDPYGAVILPGLASEPMFLAGTFEKYGIGVQVTRVGKYKSAVEPFTRKDLSPENREQLQKLLGDLWGTLRADIAASRGLEEGALQALVDAEGMMRADVAKASGLVDRVAYRDEIIAELKEETGNTATDETFKQIDLASYAKIAGSGSAAGQKSSTVSKGRRGQIAVIYAEGEIVDGEGEPGQVGGLNFSRELRRLRQDNDIKAIVLRVNSPGGSASASEAIQREMRLAVKEKPVVVSMGSYAASGGYWISAYSDRIFAEASTITGSIGVFGVLFDVKKLANDFGVTFDSVKTGQFADTFTISRPKSPAEMAMIQRAVDWIYGEFVGKVAEARKLDPGFVEEIAQGRVWSGTEAKVLGLVDELGGLQDALSYAAAKAELGENYRVVEFPRKKELAEVITELLNGFQQVRTGSGVAGQVLDRIETELNSLRTFNDPQGIYARMPLELNLQ